jgi:hypothetical protein
MAIAWLFPRKPSWQRVEPGRAADAQGQGGPGRRDRGQALARLRQAIIGSNKQEISQIFGLPRGVADQPNRVEVNRPAFWEAGMWYYPLRREEQSAMAITFDNGIAAAVQFIPSPGKIKTTSHRYPV